jgi:2-polyprenyl-6-methoxyphenol hydroxylase-like FAD-dependent oxidoreductase
MRQNISLHKHVIVIGASIGGLLTARMLRNHFEKITILEKDTVNDFPESRKGQPHTKHLHGLLPAGLNVMLQYFPTLMYELKQAGAMIIDFAESMQWFTHGGYRKSFNMGMPAVFSSRPLLEQVIRKNVLNTPGIELRDNITVKKLITTEDTTTVVGVETELKDEKQSSFLYSDLIIDVSGRGAKTFQWLKEMEYDVPPVSEVKINIGYATRLFERDANNPNSKKWFFNTPVAPFEYGSGGAFPIDGNRWIVTLSGWHGKYPETDEQSFNEYARNLSANDVYNIVSTCKPVSDISQYKYASSLRKHYEKLNRFPVGYLVLGDAMCSFNPIYGQGMTSAALQVKALDELLQTGIADIKLSKAFFSKAAKIIDIPWRLSVGEDFRYTETTGPKPAGVNLINKYVSKVHKATLKDKVVCEAFLKVMSLLKSPTSLFHPKIFWRVMRA